LKWLLITIRLFYAHIFVLSAYFWHGRPRRLYIPYPSAIVLFFLSMLPKPWRPTHVIADCFISLYDTAITDRMLFSPKSWVARVLKSLESRGYRAADTVIVDTDLNAAYFSEAFAISPTRIMVLPLSIDDTCFQPAPYQVHEGPCKVLFIGTFVPLQGVDVIAHAAVALESNREVQFRLIGFGQTAGSVERILRKRRLANVDWITQWMDSEDLAREIQSADICLGIFGAGPKVQRVWPLKNYAYMAVGRAIITAGTSQAHQMLKCTDAAPFLTVPPCAPAALATAIAGLAGDPERRRKFAENAREFYEKNLSSQDAVEQIVLQFTRSSSSTPSWHIQKSRQ
jgi:glycosyltransferase involved in cell wall biosynthesis